MDEGVIVRISGEYELSNRTIMIAKRGNKALCVATGFSENLLTLPELLCFTVGKALSQILLLRILPQAVAYTPKSFRYTVADTMFNTVCTKSKFSLQKKNTGRQTYHRYVR